MPRELFVDSPELFKFWDHDNNPGIDPTIITRQSGKDYNLKCPDCGHPFRRKIHGLKGCKYCANQERCSDLTCEKCFSNSFASKLFPTLGVFLFYLTLQRRRSVSSILRGISIMNPDCAIPVGVSIRQIAKSDNRHALKFMCRNCWHVFECEPARVCELKFCPFCSTVPKQLCPQDANCSKCFPRSFASHPKSACWDSRPGKNYDKTPFDVFKNGSHCADLICDQCGHDFQAICNNVSNGFWCPYCSRQRRCENTACDMCMGRKLSALPAAKYWNKELNPPGITPDQISLTNGRVKWWFDCENGIHPPYQRDASHIRRNQLCSECNCPRKTELMLCDALREMDLPYHKEFTPKWCRTGATNSFYRFDVYIEGTKVLIELDGEQHFEERWKFGCPNERRKVDVWKMKCAVKNEFSGIRLYQPDVLDGRWDWKEWLRRAIEFVQKQKYPCWVFQTSPVYEDHIADSEKDGIKVYVIG